MSRTDKDRPYMVRANDPLTKHRIPHHYHYKFGMGTVDCDFAEAEAEWETDFKRRTEKPRWSSFHSCGWGFKWTEGGVPAWYTHCCWYDPERSRERDELGMAKKLYNAGDDLEDFDFNCPQHRHSAAWDYW